MCVCVSVQAAWSGGRLLRPAHHLQGPQQDENLPGQCHSSTHAFALKYLIPMIHVSDS